MQDKDFWKLYAWVVRGKQRRLALIFMERPMTVTELKKKINSNVKLSQKQLSLREVSRQLTSFEKKGIDKCLNPKEPLGHIYQLTQKGNIVREEILKDLQSHKVDKG